MSTTDETMHRDLIVLSIWKYTKADREEYPLESGYFVDGRGFAHEISEGIPDEQLAEDIICFDILYVPDLLWERLREDWASFFYELDLTAILKGGHINTLGQRQQPADTLVVMEWFYANKYDPYTGEHDTDFGSISIKPLDMTPLRLVGDPQDNITKCPRCGSFNRIDVQDALEVGIVVEAKTFCLNPRCGHLDFWYCGHYSYLERGLTQS